MALADSFNNISPLQKLIIFILMLTVIVGGFIYFIYIPDNAEIARISKEIESLDREIEIHKTRVKRLAELKKEMEEAQRELALKKDQLPPESEAVQLLKDAERLGNKVGLNIKLWRPGGRRVNPSGLYVELPVDVEYSGSYHEFGMFFDQISKFKQVVNISNLKVGGAHQERGKLVEPVTFVATAFASVDKKEPQPQTEKKP